MGTYLSLELKRKSDREVKRVNKLWDTENPGYEGTLRFTTKADIEKDIEAIHKDPEQEHLRYIKTVEDWNRNFRIWGVGTMQVKITLGDYLCSEMARRYRLFIEKYPDLFVELPDDYELEVMLDAEKGGQKAESCLAQCPYCMEEYYVEVRLTFNGHLTLKAPSKEAAEQKAEEIVRVPVAPVDFSGVQWGLEKRYKASQHKAEK